MPKVAPATIEDVASLARVSTSTVSKVLNDYKGVSQQAKSRVHAAISQLNYSPNRAARTFRTGRTQTVSVFLPQFGGEFYDRLIRAIDNELAVSDFDAALFPLLSTERLKRYQNPAALPYQSDGVIFTSLNPDWLFKNAKLPAPIPAVLVDAYHADYDTVTVANAFGAESATTHLLSRPTPTFMLQVEHFDDRDFASGVFVERLKGFKRAHATHKVQIRSDAVVTLPIDSEAARKACHLLFDMHGPAINIFASCDLLAKGVLDACADRSLRPGGGGPWVVGFDDLSWSESSGLSTVRQPIEEMGRTVANWLLERIAEPHAPVRHMEFAPELVVRKSSGKGE